MWNLVGLIKIWQDWNPPPPKHKKKIRWNENPIFFALIVDALYT